MGKTWNSRFDDLELVAVVLRRDAIRERHRRLAARDNQVAIARDMNVPQSIISKLVLDRRPTIQLTPEQHDEVLIRYARCQHHTAIARQHSARTVCRELAICPNTRARILRERQGVRQQRRRRAQQESPPPVHRFLTMRLSP